MSDVIGSSRLCSQFATIKEQVVMGDTRTEDFSKILTGLDLCYDWDSKGLPELTRRQPPEPRTILENPDEAEV